MLEISKRPTRQTMRIAAVLVFSYFKRKAMWNCAVLFNGSANSKLKLVIHERVLACAHHNV
jgi:hypothetical protein